MRRGLESVQNIHLYPVFKQFAVAAISNHTSARLFNKQDNSR